MQKIICFFILLTISCYSFAGLGNKKVKICDDAATWPPYAYHPIQNGAEDKSKAIGATVDLLKEVFKNLKLEMQYDLIPWKRCLGSVKFYTHEHEYEMFANGSLNEDRQANYYVSVPIYNTNQGLFYSKNVFQKKPNITTFGKANNFRVCGILGYNYEIFNDLDKDNIDLGATSINSIISKLNTGRCDFYPSSIQPVLGAETVGKIDLKNIEHLTTTDGKIIPFYVFVSKKSPRGKELIEAINKEILKLQESGQAEQIFKKYLPAGTDL